MQPRNSKEVAEFYNEDSKSVRKTFCTTSRLKGGDNSWRCGTASCLRTGSGGGFSRARQLVDGRYTRRGIAWLVVQILTSQERTVTMELMCFGVPKRYVLSLFSNWFHFKILPSTHLTSKYYIRLLRTSHCVILCLTYWLITIKQSVKHTATPMLHLADAVHICAFALRLHIKISS